jgi:hypothetical protein
MQNLLHSTVYNSLIKGKMVALETQTLALKTALRVLYSREMGKSRRELGIVWSFVVRIFD